MPKLINIVKREIRAKVMTKGFIISTILGPIFMLGIMFGPAYFMSLAEKKPVPMLIVDGTGKLKQKLPEIFADTLKDGRPRFILTVIDSQQYALNKDLFLRDLEKKTYKYILIIPRTVLQRKGTLTFIGKSVSDMEFMQLVRERLQQFFTRQQFIQAGLNPDLIQKLSTHLKIKTVKLEKGKAREKGWGQEFATAFVFLMILYMTSIFYGNFTLRGVLEEKTSRVVEILLSSTNSFTLMMGKVLGVGAVGLIQYAAWIGIALIGMFLASGFIPSIMQYVHLEPSVFLYFVIFFLIGYFQISTLYAAVGAMCSSMDDAQSLAAPITILIIIPFIISFSVIRDPGSSMAIGMSFVPFFTPMLMFLRILLSTPPWYHIWGAIAINIAAIVVFTWISARLYRVAILMYGKRPTLPQILKWIRYA